MTPVIQKASQADFSKIVLLLQRYGLPTQDIQWEKQVFFAMKDAGEIIGCIAYEAYGLQALLRSLAVQHNHKSKGYGILLTEHLLSNLRSQGFQNIYLLTNTAEQFFQKFQFQNCDRSQVHKTILDSDEFHHLCPSTAVCMHLPFT